MESFQDGSLSAPSDFTENMTMYMSEEFDIARWREQRKSNKPKEKKPATETASINKAEKGTKDSKEEEVITSKEKQDYASSKASSRVSSSYEHSAKESAPTKHPPMASESSKSSSRSSSRPPTSTMDLPGFVWPPSAEPTQDHTQSQQMLTQIQDLQFQLEQSQSEKALLKEENDKFRTEVSDLRLQFEELAEQLAEFQVEYDALQKERHTIAKVLMQEWGMKEVGRVKKSNGTEGVGFKYT